MAIPAPSPCPSFEALHDAADASTLPADLASHVAACETCRALLTSIREDNALAAELAAADAATRIARAATRVTPGGEPAAAELAPGARIAGYTIRGVLGAGAMGMVYLAEQDHPRRPVALKLIRADYASADTLRRFEHEAAALALLKHPGIAQVYQAGSATVEGDARGPRPFMAMELVDGQTLDHYVKTRSPSRAERLRLVAALADAVDHAHRRGVIHRDLKPSNIIVESDQATKRPSKDGKHDAGGAVSGAAVASPRILDFGIAKLTEEAPGPDTTQPGGFVGTFAYAAPEQVAGDPGAIDARADVFALGVILYELLVGQRPFDLGTSLADAVRAITEARMIAPATRGVALDGELLTILTVALSPAPERRYQSAASLGEDLRRYLDKRPLRARPDSTLYTLRKAIARHPYRAATAAAFVVLATTAAAVAITLQLRATAAARLQASVSDTFLTALESTDRDADDTPNVITVDDLFNTFGQSIDQRLREHPRERADYLLRLGRAMASHRRFERAESILEGVLATRRAARPADPLAIAEAAYELARVCSRLNKYQQADDLLREALAARTAAYGPRDERTLDVLHSLGGNLNLWKRYDQAEAIFREVVAQQRRANADSWRLPKALNDLSAAIRPQGRFEEALEVSRESLAELERVMGHEHKHVPVAIANVVANLISLERYDEARPLIERGHAIRLKIFGPDDPRIADSLVQMANLERRIGGDGQSPAAQQALNRAVQYVSDALRIRQNIYKGDHESIAEGLSILGQIRMRQAQHADACPTLRAAMEMRTRLPRAADGDVGHSESLLGECLGLGGRNPEAERLLRSGLDKVRSAYGPDHARTRDAEERLRVYLERIR